MIEGLSPEVVHLAIAFLLGGLVMRWRDVWRFLHEMRQPVPDQAICVHAPGGDGFCTCCGTRLDPLPYVRHTLDLVHDPSHGEVDFP